MSVSNFYRSYYAYSPLISLFALQIDFIYAVIWIEWCVWCHDEAETISIQVFIRLKHTTMIWPDELS